MSWTGSETSALNSFQEELCEAYGRLRRSTVDPAAHERPSNVDLVDFAVTRPTDFVTSQQE